MVDLPISGLNSKQQSPRSRTAEHVITTDREYLHLSALAAGCTLRLPAVAIGRRAELLYGVRIAGVRHAAEQDLAKLLHSFRQMGFTEVALHPIVCHHPAATLPHMIEDAGLRALTRHFSLSSIEADFDYVREVCLA